MKKILIIFWILFFTICCFIFYQNFLWKNNEKNLSQNIEKFPENIWININNDFSKNTRIQSLKEWINENLDPFDNYEIEINKNEQISFVQKTFQPYYLDNENIVMKEKINEEKRTIKQWIYNEKTKNFSMNFYKFLPNN